MLLYPTQTMFEFLQTELALLFCREAPEAR